MIKIGFMASHGGSGMNAILKAIDKGLDVQASVLISNNKQADAFLVANAHHLQCYHLSARTHPQAQQLDEAIYSTFENHNVELILLSGYMKKIGGLMLTNYKNRILNIHPALLPKFGGQGMYGDRVHQAVLQQGENQSGASVHIVTAQYDQGPVLKQRTVPITDAESITSLREKIKSIEGQLYVDTLTSIVAGDIKLP